MHAQFIRNFLSCKFDFSASQIIISSEGKFDFIWRCIRRSTDKFKASFELPFFYSGSARLVP